MRRSDDREELLPMTLRTVARDVVVSGLELVPLEVWQWLRDGQFKQGKVRAPLGRLAMRVARHRSIGARDASFQIPDEPGVRMTNDGSFIARQVFWLGRQGHEGPEAQYWQAFCSHATSILELGANIGFFTLHGARVAPHAKYVAVEANPVSMRSIAANLALNGIEHVTLVQRAVVGERTSDFVELHLPDLERSASATGAYIGGGEGIDRPASRSVRVEAIEARELFAGVDLVRLDIEGQEHDVLASVLETIRASEPLMFVEVRRRTPKLRALLHDLATNSGWSVHALAPDGCHRVEAAELPTIVLQEAFGTRDVALVPPSRAEAFARGMDELATRNARRAASVAADR
jgi:FkbM family methyltransferase